MKSDRPEVLDYFGPSAPQSGHRPIRDYVSPPRIRHPAVMIGLVWMLIALLALCVLMLLGR